MNTVSMYHTHTHHRARTHARAHAEKWTIRWAHLERRVSRGAALGAREVAALPPRECSAAEPGVRRAAGRLCRLCRLGHLRGRRHLRAVHLLPRAPAVPSHWAQAPRGAGITALCPEHRSIRGFGRRLSAETARSQAHRRLGLRHRQPALCPPAQMAEARVCRTSSAAGRQNCPPAPGLL